MNQDNSLDAMLRTLGGTDDAKMVPEGFMGGVWHRAGQMAEAIETRRRLALFAAIFVTGLGGGFWTIQKPVPEAPTYQLSAGADLSPAALLHIQS